MKKIFKDPTKVFYEHLSSLGIDCELVEKKSMKIQPSSRLYGKYCIQISGRDIDLIDAQVQSSQYSSSIILHYLVSGEKGDRNALKVKAKIKSRGIIKREIMGFNWVGGALADSLNIDSKLNEELLQKFREREIPNISIAYSPKREVTMITTTYQGYKIKVLPSIESLDIYDGIAKHIKEQFY